MEQWTKHEQESARLTVSLSYKMGKVKMECKPLRIKLHDMSTRDFNTLKKLLDKYSNKNKSDKPLMKLMK